MEYNLLKTIESPLSSSVTKQIIPRLSPYPATDYVNPGLGQISRLYNFYVPLPANYNLHHIKKKVANVSENLEGFGKADSDRTNEEEHISQDEDPIQFNEVKRKRLGESIQESFLHPKLIKTNKITFASETSKPKKPSEKSKSTLTKIEPLKVEKTVKHKFQLIN